MPDVTCSVFSRALLARVALCVGLLMTLLPVPAPVAAQNLFAPAARVNDRVITRYEVRQRARFLKILGANGDLNKQSLDRLIEERVQFDAAAALGLSVTEAGIQAGMEEFAKRANMDANKLIAALRRAGVEEETFRAFVEAGLLWREVIRTKFAESTRIDSIEIDRALAQPQAGSTKGVRVLLSEIILPANSAAAKKRADARTAEILGLNSIPAFAAAARKYSAAASRGRGGRIDWLPLSNLPGNIGSQILTLKPGQVAGPFPVTNSVAFFQLREIEEGGPGATAKAVDYAQFLFPGQRTESNLKALLKVAGKVDTCDDLYAFARKEPKRLIRVLQPTEAVPGDIAIELAKLDPNEISTALVRGGNLVLLMLCQRTRMQNQQGDDGPDRKAVENRLLNQRLSGQAAAYLAELKANASIALAR